MTVPKNYPNKAYLGDGAYVQQGAFGCEVILTTEDGINVQNQVVLAQNEIAVLLTWLVQHGGYDAEKMQGLLERSKP